MFYDKSSFFKTISNVFRTDYVCSLSSQFTLLIIKIYSFPLDLLKSLLTLTEFLKKYDDMKLVETIPGIMYDCYKVQKKMC